MRKLKANLYRLGLLRLAAFQSRLDKRIDLNQISDDWFFDHFIFAPRVINKWTGTASNILDFGCGDGIMALAMSLKHPAASVTGVDLHDAFKYLAETAHSQIKLDRLPTNLSFETITQGQSFPRKFDLAYSWSVFEHINRDEIPSVLRQIQACLVPGGRFFLQIAPLYFSPFGSHLQGVISRPWAHLLLPEQELLSEIVGVDLQVFGKEFRNKAFELCSSDDFKQFLVREYLSLNRITTTELLAMCEQAGFTVTQSFSRKTRLRVPTALLRENSRENLTTVEIRLLLTVT